MGPFLAGGNFQLANLNQPLRFNNYTGAEVQTVLSLYAESLLVSIIPLNQKRPSLT